MKILFVSLGCDKNLVDSEKMLGVLNNRGYSFTEDEDEADIIIINTCSFISDAKEESIQEIIRLSEYKKTGKLRALLITGCLSERYREQIKTELPEVDGMIGISSIDRIAELIDNVLSDGEKEFFAPKSDNIKPSIGLKDRVLTTGGYYAYLKIAEGCNKRCTYCSIPSIRGPYNSVPMEDILEEANELVGRGVRELILVAQETTVYGVDIYGRKCLPELLTKLCNIEELKMIRLFYCYPEEITDELIDTVRNNSKICKYFDIPIQHCENHILKKMGRRTTKEELKARIESIREKLPEVALRTTLIAGFPGETDDDHEKMLEFIDEMEFTHLGAFAYSPEEDTPAAVMPEQVDEDVKKQRVANIMELQKEICADNNEKLIGECFDAIIDGYLPEEECYVGRSYMDAPGVDSYIFIKSDFSFMSGDIVKIRITGASEYDLIGELEDESTE